MVKEISGDVFKSWIDSGKNLTIVDARDLEDYKKGHIAEAVSLLNMDVEKRKNEIMKFVQPVVVYSNDVNCPESSYMAEKIEKLGLREVYNYNPSYKDWIERGYPIVKMEKPVILHLSDIHCDRTTKNSKKAQEKIKERLNALYIAVKEWEKKSVGRPLPNILVISGDLVKTGSEGDFELVKQFIEGIKNEYEIDWRNILICPGNHDEFRGDSENPLTGYTNYINFHNKLLDNNQESILTEDERFEKKFRKNISPSRINYFRLFVNLKIIFISVNAYKVKYKYKKDGLGVNINLKELEKLLSEVKKLKKVEDYLKIVILHYNLLPCLYGEISKDKEAEIISNSLEVIRRFSQNDIGLVLHGHAHSPLTVDTNFIFESSNYKDMIICSAGSFYNEKNTNSFDDSFEIIEINSIVDQYKNVPNININKFEYDDKIYIWRQKDFFKVPIYKKFFNINKNLYDVLLKFKDENYLKNHININDKKFVTKHFNEYLSKAEINDPSVSSFLKKNIEKAQKIDLVCWSFATISQQFEESFKLFLEKPNVKLNLLMLIPESIGYYEKNTFETFKVPLNNWEETYKEENESYADDFNNSFDRVLGNHWPANINIDIEKKLRKIEVKFYADTPRVSGWIFDDKIFILTYYFLNPILRGSNLPVIVVDETDILAIEFLNWFNIKFAIGLDITQIGRQKWK